MNKKEFKNFVATVTFDMLKRRDKALTNKELYSIVGVSLGWLTEKDKNERYESGANKLQNIIQFGLLGLRKMGLVDHPDRGLWSISQKGREKTELTTTEYADFQRKFWNEEISKKRKSSLGTNDRVDQIDIFEVSPGKNKKEQMLYEILEQNKRILNYLLGK